MKEGYLSTFQPRGFLKKGGIPIIHALQRVKSVPGDTTGLSEQAKDIYAWLQQQPEGPILVSDIIKEHGYRHRLPYGQDDTKTLNAFPLEELVDASLLYVVEDAE